jgi:hypothetical protein
MALKLRRKTRPVAGSRAAKPPKPHFLLKWRAALLRLANNTPFGVH